MPQSIKTDDLGRFRIASVAPGKYRLAVTQNFAAGINFGDDMMEAFDPAGRMGGKLTIYSGNTLHRKDAKVIEVRAGETVDGIEMTLPLNGLHTVEGTVSGKDGTLLNAGSLDLTDTSDSSIAFHGKILGGGEFRFSGIPEGLYELKVTNGRVFDNIPGDDVPEETLHYDPAQYKPLRAFAETKVGVAVEVNDVAGLSVTVVETKVPEVKVGDEGGEQSHFVVK
jgi:hypothetical protein